MALFDIDLIRTILSTETDADSAITEELMSQIRENDQGLFALVFYAGAGGTATSDPPNDTTGVLTDTAASYSTDEHNGRSLVMLDGLAAGNIYTIDDTTSTTIICTGDNLYADGVRSGDTYKIFYDLKNTSGHDHDGINSAVVVLADSQVTTAKLQNSAVTEAKIATSAVAQSKLKTSTGSVSTGTAQNVILSGGEYGFYPQISRPAGATGWYAQIANADGSIYTSYTTIIYLYMTSGTVGAKQRYVTSSGERHWIFILRDPKAGDTLAQWEAPDHVCFGNGSKPRLVPHPFPDCFVENGKYYQYRRDDKGKMLTEKLERQIIVVNPALEEVEAVLGNAQVIDEDKPDKSFLDSFNELYEIDESKNLIPDDTPVTVGLLDDNGGPLVDWRFQNPDKKVKLLKKTIEIPPTIEVAGLRKKKVSGVSK